MSDSGSEVWSCPICIVGAIKDNFCNKCGARFCEVCHGRTNEIWKSKGMLICHCNEKKSPTQSWVGYHGPVNIESFDNGKESSKSAVDFEKLHRQRLIDRVKLSSGEDSVERLKNDLLYDIVESTYRVLMFQKDALGYAYVSNGDPKSEFKKEACDKYLNDATFHTLVDLQMTKIFASLEKHDLFELMRRYEKYASKDGF